MKAIRTHGGVKRHHHTLLGMNGRFDTLQAAVVLAKMPGFEWELRERTRIGERYAALLDSGCIVPAVAPGNTHVFAQYTIRVPDRDRVAERLKSAGIPSAVYYPKCLHEQPVFAGLGYKWGDFPESEKASREVLGCRCILSCPMWTRIEWSLPSPAFSAPAELANVPAG